MLGKLFKKNKTPQNEGTGEAELPTKLVTKYYLNAKSLKGKPLFELTGKHIIGSDEADIILEDKNVSAPHMEVELVDGVVTVMDLSSEKGTFLGKKQIEPNKKVILRDGDILKLGKLKLIFEEVDEEIPDLDAQNAHVTNLENEIADETSPEENLSEQEDTPSAPAPAQAADDSNELTLEEPASPSAQADSGASDELTLEDSGGEETPDLSEDELIVEEDEKDDKSETKADHGLKVDQEELAATPLKDRTEKTFKLKLYDYDKPDPDAIFKYDESESDNSDKTLTRKIMSALNIKKQQKGLKVKAKKATVVPAANGIVRFLGLIFDTVIFSIVFSLMPQQKTVLVQVDQLITKLLEVVKPLWSQHAMKYVDIAYKEVPALAKMQAEIVKSYKPEYYEYMQILIVFIGFQIIMSLLFGITLGQFFFGMKARGNFFLKRILAPLRVIFNYLFLPLFILLELPTVFSKRSFKEVISFTHIEFVSKARIFITLFIIIPLMGFGFIVSPLFQDFTIPQPIKVIANTNFKIKPDENKFEQGSGVLGFVYENEKAQFYPMIKTVQKEGKKHIILGTRIIISGEDTINSIEIFRDKSLNLSKFFKQYTKLNPMVYLNHKTLLSIVNDASNNNPNFKNTKFPKDQIASEVQNVLEGALTFDINQLDQIQSFATKYGPFFTGHMNIRQKLLKLVNEPIKEVSIKQNGLSFAMNIYTEVGKDKYLYIIPMNAIKTYIYKVKFEIADQISEIDKIRFNVPSDISNYSSLDFLRPYAKKNQVEIKVDEIFQNTYKIMFDSATQFLSEENAKALALLQKSIREMIDLLEANEQTTKLKKEIVDKMIQNLNDLLQAIVEKNNKFFGIKKTKTV